MGKTAKAMLLLSIILMFAAYSILSHTLMSSHASRMDENERKALLYDLKRQQLFKQVTNLQTVRTQLMEQLEEELEDSAEREELVKMLEGMPKPSGLNRSVAAPPETIEAAPAMVSPPAQTSALLDRLKKIKQVKRKTSSSTTSRKPTRAS